MRARAPCVLKMQFRPRIGVSPPQKHIFRHATCLVSLNLVFKMRARASCVLKMQFRPRIWVPSPQKHKFRHATCIISLNLVLKMRARAPCLLKMQFRPRIWLYQPQLHMNRHTTCNFLWILRLECARARVRATQAWNAVLTSDFKFPFQKKLKL